jgi:hypothetical protein
VRSAAVAALLAGLMLVACSSGPSGLGKGACPYLRPRLIRLDAARADASTSNINAVAQDVALFVKTNLPDGGKAKSDQPLVQFSTALSAFAKGGVSGPLDAAESVIKKECAVPS